MLESEELPYGRTDTTSDQSLNGKERAGEVQWVRGEDGLNRWEKGEEGIGGRVHVRARDQGCLLGWGWCVGVCGLLQG